MEKIKCTAECQPRAGPRDGYLAKAVAFLWFPFIEIHSQAPRPRSSVRIRLRAQPRIPRPNANETFWPHSVHFPLPSLRLPTSEPQLSSLGQRWLGLFCLLLPSQVTERFLEIFHLYVQSQLPPPPLTGAAKAEQKRFCALPDVTALGLRLVSLRPANDSRTLHRDAKQQ